MSVIVPVKDDAVRLDTCLRLLHAQQCTFDFEVLVIDNGSADRPDAIVARYPGTKLLTEPRPSSYAARNRGVQEATAEILAFTDSDCRPQADWLQAGVDALRSYGPRCFVGGAVIVTPHDEEHPTGLELYEMIHGFPQEIYLRDLGFSVTANLFAYRATFDDVGDFSETLISSGDRDWGQRARSRAYQPRFCDQAIVEHPARRSTTELRRKMRRLRRGEEQTAALSSTAVPRSNLVRLAIPPIRSTIQRAPQVRPLTASNIARYSLAVVATHYLRGYEELRSRIARRLEASWNTRLTGSWR